MQSLAHNVDFDIFASEMKTAKVSWRHMRASMYTHMKASVNAC